jgi:IS66 C-terminal element
LIAEVVARTLDGLTSRAISNSRPGTIDGRCFHKRGADRAAAIATLDMTAKLNDVDPQAWLADVLARIADHPTQRLEELLPWRWAVLTRVDQAA